MSRQPDWNSAAIHTVERDGLKYVAIRFSSAGGTLLQASQDLEQRKTGLTAP